MITHSIHNPVTFNWGFCLPPEGFVYCITRMAGIDEGRAGMLTSFSFNIGGHPAGMRSFYQRYFI
jgi:hypothetical protein